MKLWPFGRGQTPAGEERFSLNDYASWTSSFSYNGTLYSAPNVRQTLAGEAEPAPDGFVAMAQQAFGSNAVTFACLAFRQLVFSAVRFQWQQMNNGRPSKMFGTPALAPLEVPWAAGTTQDLLVRMIQDADLAGNAYHVTDTPLAVLGSQDPKVEIVRLRPDWVDNVREARMIRGKQVGYRRLGILYTEGGPRSGAEPQVFAVGEFSHFAPLPDPLASWRGMSWLTPVARELQADNLMTTHKRKFFENGATPNTIVRYPEGATQKSIQDVAKLFDLKSEGVDNAYRTIHIGGGADVTVVGANLGVIDFKAIQGAGETRIAAAAGIPPVVLGLSEGLAGSSLNAGNYGQARRRAADGTMHPLWQNATGSLAPLVGRPPGPGVRLWYDTRDVPFLREDEKDSAEIAGRRATTIRTYTDAGFTPDSAVAAVMADDETLLVHSGLFSVQLQAPGTGMPADPPVPPAGGKAA